MQTDFDFFEAEIQRFQEYLNEGSLMERRIENGDCKKDPLEELVEVNTEVEVIETDFQKAIEIC